uniref:Uncharacterized protein n=1 Tax=Cacopsylla melanoneura TaxID=428564 RepID=A0A8D8X6Q3_9HEMI
MLSWVTDSLNTLHTIFFIYSTNVLSLLSLHFRFSSTHQNILILVSLLILFLLLDFFVLFVRKKMVVGYIYFCFVCVPKKEDFWCYLWIIIFLFLKLICVIIFCFRYSLIIRTVVNQQ